MMWYIIQSQGKFALGTFYFTTGYLYITIETHNVPWEVGYLMFKLWVLNFWTSSYSDSGLGKTPRGSKQDAVSRVSGVHRDRDFYLRQQCDLDGVFNDSSDRVRNHSLHPGEPFACDHTVTPCWACFFLWVAGICFYLLFICLCCSSLLQLRRWLLLHSLLRR